MHDVTLPEPLELLREELLDVSPRDRLELLAEIGAELPAVEPAEAETFERVIECQSPVYLDVSLGRDARVRLRISVPPGAPMTRGFAAALVQGVDGHEPAALLGLPEDLPSVLGLGDLVSPLRRSGMVALQARAKRQLLERIAADERA
ncbi:SufE family protein [Pseudoclavibacter terrae]|uniref:SufE family protein n=1 Tax=Pseudoclavibacter terrae TaxID=1530195 RepID=A0A7J5B3B8_9MICO|nr:SufE family protein [Pseudoclavibacter terrae]KAB1638517.1 SufE family protein [Pseudoclavibacter terrae]